MQPHHSSSCQAASLRDWVSNAATQAVWTLTDTQYLARLCKVELPVVVAHGDPKLVVCQPKALAEYSGATCGSAVQHRMACQVMSLPQTAQD